MPELILPDDKRWTMGCGLVHFARDYAPIQQSHVTCVSYTTLTGDMRNEIRDAAAVAACWWRERYVPKDILDIRHQQKQFRAWSALTTAESLDGYTFMPGCKWN